MNSKRSVSSVSSVIASIGLTLLLSACAGVYQNQGAGTPPVPDLEDPMQRAASLMRYCGKLQETGDLQLAAAICNRAHELDLTDPEPLLEIAGIMGSLGNPEAAAESYRKVLLLDPQHVDALYGLGKIYIDSQRYDLALMQLEQAMLADNSDPRIYNALGIIMDQRGDHAAAQDYYHSGLQQSPQNPSLRNNLGLSLVLAGDPDAGLALLREVASEPGVGAAASRNLAIANQLAGGPRNDPPPPPQISALAVEPQASLESRPPHTEDLVDLAPTAGDPLSGPHPRATRLRQVTPEGTHRPLPLLQTFGPDSEAPRLAVTESRNSAAAVDPVIRPAAETRETVSQAMIPQEEELPDTAAGPEPFVTPAAPVASTTPLVTSRLIQTDDAAIPAHPSQQAPHGTSEDVPRRADKGPQDEYLAVQTAKPAKPAAAKSAAAKVPDSGEWIHSVQLSSFPSARGARRSWDIIRAAGADLLAGLDVVILRVDLGIEDGIVYRVRTVAMEWRAANQLCTQLKGKGLDCLTVKASRQETIEATVERICALNATPGSCAAPLTAPLRSTSLPARHPSTG